MSFNIKHGLIDEPTDLGLRLDAQVCTVLGHERRGSLPSTCCCNFTCQVTCQFSAGGQRPSSKRCLTKLCLKVEAQSDQLCVPATGQAPELTRLEKPGP